MENLKERDSYLEALWKKFGDVPMDPESETMEEEFIGFPAGTHREDIWHWFDERHSKGVSYLLYHIPCYETEDTFYKYVKKEIPYRLEENFGLSDIPEEIIQKCVDAFWNDTDIIRLMNDRMDEHIEKVLEEHGIDYEN